MGPSRLDPNRMVGVFPSDLLKGLAAVRAVEIEAFRWIAGDWSYENSVPATGVSPAYIDIGSMRYSFCEENSWVYVVSPDGRQHRHITFDPFSKQWIYVLTRGSYGVLRSLEGWTGNQIVFSGLMTMIGINCEWRMTWTKASDTEFLFVNEEKSTDGSWTYVDEWRLKRKCS